MGQSAFTVFTQISPERVDALVELLDNVESRGKGDSDVFAGFPQLHYASFSIMVDNTGVSSLLFEGNVDGSARAFLQKLWQDAEPILRAIYAHCVQAPDGADRKTFLKYLNTHDIGADTFYVAWPGHTVSQIIQEQLLHDHIVEFINSEENAELRSQDADQIHAAIVESVRADRAMLWALTDVPRPFLIRHGPKVLWLLIGGAALSLAALLRTAFGCRKSGYRPIARLLVATLTTTALELIRRLRAHEKADDIVSDSRPDWRTTYAKWSRDHLRIQAGEDIETQNHLASIADIKPGLFRFVLLRFVLTVINAAARLTATNGSLANISSIHFARWVITPDKRRLVFLSNFDNSWESYLGEFIELAASGLTAVWTNTDNAVGFPHTQFLLGDGARDEARFKAYARYGMVQTRVWYSAYPNLSVANIGNNNSIRRGLGATLDAAAAQAWLRRL